MKRFILFLTRVYLGLKKYEGFQFVNQKSDAVYCFGDDAIYKFYSYGPGYGGSITKSNVSFNWLFDDECKIIKVGMTGLEYFNVEITG